MTIELLDLAMLRHAARPRTDVIWRALEVNWHNMGSVDLRPGLLRLEMFTLCSERRQGLPGMAIASG
jgi:hypothetical protein